MSDKPENPIDWSLTSWQGARRESLRRWSKLPLEEIIAALEEMENLNTLLHGPALPARVTEPETVYKNTSKLRETDKGEREK
jgi:hypothetical protein